MPRFAWSLILTATCLLTACGGAPTTATSRPDADPTASAAKRDATKSAFALFAGLDDYAPEKRDNFLRIQAAFSMLASVGSTPKSDVFLCADSGVDDDSFRTKVAPKQAWDAGFERLGELDTNHTAALRDYLGWVGGHTNAGATHLAVLTHGGGYAGVLLDYDGKPAVPARSLTLQNTAKALAKGYKGGRLDSLTLDACMMASIEVGEALKGTVAVLAASEDFCMMGSMPYDDLAGALAARPMTGEAFGRHVATALIKHGKGGQYNSRTFSALALDVRYDRLVAKVDRLSTALLKALATEPEAVKAACLDTRMFALMAEYAPHYGDYHQRDLVDLCRALERRVSSPAVKAACADVEAALAPVVLANVVHPTETMAHGLAIYMPVGLKANEREAWLKPYRDCVFARHTHWDEFLDALNALG
jgi:hypothetical protein